MAGKKGMPPELKTKMQAARALVKDGKTAEAAAAFTAVAGEAVTQKLRRPAIRAHLAATGAHLRGKDHDAAKASLDKACELVKSAKQPEGVAKGLSIFVGRLRKKGRDKVADFVTQHAEAAIGFPLPAVADGDDED